MGSLMFKDVGIVNFAPQLRPMGDCSGFGLSSKAQHLKIKREDSNCSFSYQNRLGFPHVRKTGLEWLTDSGFSGMWFTAHLETTFDTLSFEIHFEGFRPLSEIAFSFFCQAQRCVVAKSHRLHPRSLDRYLGPPQMVELRGNEGRLLIEPIGCSHMEIIPLAGDRGFWGSDFLLAFSFTSPQIGFHIQTENMLV